MRYKKLGRTGLTVSRMCLGTMNFGGVTDEKESFRIMDAAIDMGITFFDTANFYGNAYGKGETESLIGRYFKANPGKREKIVLATKLFCTMGPGPNDKGLNALHIRNEIKNSLARLQTDHIDLYQMHHYDRGVRSPLELQNAGVAAEFEMELGTRTHLNTPWEEIWQALQKVVYDGDAIYIGSCNFPAWGIAYANGIASHRGLLGIVSEQSKYSLNCRKVELEVLPACRELGLGFLPFSPLGGGLLGGVLNAKGGRRGGLDLGADRPRVEAYEALCADLGEAPANIAMAWLLHNPIVTCPILGPRTAEQLLSYQRALEIRLSPEVLQRLDEIWPGPGGEAPEAYAW